MPPHSVRFTFTTSRLCANDRIVGTLVRQPAASRASTFNTQSASELQAFRLDLLGFQTILEQLGSDNGLANYDNTNALEKVLKEMVNSVKYMLTDIDQMVVALPVLGPTLGPSTFG